LKNNYSAYKPFLVFLGKFFLAYLVLFFSYQYYLSSFEGHVDTFTQWVSHVSANLLVFLGYDAKILVSTTLPCYDFYIHNQLISRIIEGCNGLSVIILFVSFIIAFSNKIKPTVLYALFGALIICLLNILRVAFINVLLYTYPRYNVILHDLLFPALLYGVVFILWMIWVNKFSKYA
jgi:exosortase family protein XrtF